MLTIYRNTIGFGMVTDFNLMTTGNVKGKINSKILQANESVERLIFEEENFVCIYLVKGFAEIILGDEIYKLNSNELIVFENENKREIITIHAFEYSEMVEVIVILNCL